jgi:hypothetical protein
MAHFGACWFLYIIGLVGGTLKHRGGSAVMRNTGAGAGAAAVSTQLAAAGLAAQAVRAALGGVP